MRVQRRTHRVASPAPTNGKKIHVVDAASRGCHIIAAHSGGKQSPRYIMGMRTCLAWFGGFLPVTVLNLIVPLIALYRGDVKIPNLLISDVMASHSFYEALYTWGFTINMLNSCFVMREATALWRKNLPERAPDIARFVGILYLICAPSLFGVVSFQYSPDLDIFTSAYNLDLLVWLLHCGSASSCFLSVCAMAIIYGWRLGPALIKKDLVHPADRFWRMIAVNGIVVFTFAGVLVRGLHLLHDPTQWCIALLVVEEALIQMMQVGVFVGTTRDMMSLDASDPIFNLSDLIR